VVLTPAKLITLIEAGAASDSVALMGISVMGVAAKARQISAVPLWAEVLLTSTHGRPPPETPVIITCAECIILPVATGPVAKNARISSLLESVENPETAMALLAIDS
jgi:hypothetical protein